MMTAIHLDDANDEDEDGAEAEEVVERRRSNLGYRLTLLPSYLLDSSRIFPPEGNKACSTARPTRGQGIDYGFVSSVDAEERVIELAELHERDTQDLYALLEDARIVGLSQYGRWRRKAYACPDEAWLLIGLRQVNSSGAFRPIVTSCMHMRPISGHTRTQLQLQSSLIPTQHHVQRDSLFRLRTAGSMQPLREMIVGAGPRIGRDFRVIRDLWQRDERHAG
ncbi:hypothetical protein Tco_0491096 [Tanacetum coccineum]